MSTVYSDKELQQSRVFKIAERHLDRVVNSPLPSRFPEVTGLGSNPEPQTTPPQEKTSIPQKNGDTVRREIDRLARQTEGISKALKRVRDSLK